jgi:hypothetical protein
MTPLFQTAIQRFDEENAKDPHSDQMDGRNQPKELVYAERLTDWVLKLSPDASEILQLAARCQHLCRWKIPRNQYEMNRTGYLKWRSDLKKFHSEKAGGILKEVGYNSEIIEKVQALNLKKNFPNDPESQILEDALCLVFLEFQLEDFAKKNPEDKVIQILQKTWKKMSANAHQQALNLPFENSVRTLITRAISTI